MAIYNVFLFKRERGGQLSEPQEEVFAALQTLFDPSRGKEKLEQEESADKPDSPNP